MLFVLVSVLIHLVEEEAGSTSSEGEKDVVTTLPRWPVGHDTGGLWEVRSEMGSGSAGGRCLGNGGWKERAAKWAGQSGRSTKMSRNRAIGAI